MQNITFAVYSQRKLCNQKTSAGLGDVAASGGLPGGPDGPHRVPEQGRCTGIWYGDKYLGPLSRMSCRRGIPTHLARPRVVSPSHSRRR